jgi:hypothetical protein
VRLRLKGIECGTKPYEMLIERLQIGFFAFCIVMRNELYYGTQNRTVIGHFTA